MGEFITESVHWKKGEKGDQQFILFESDGTTRRDGTGLTYEFQFWKKNASSLKGGGALIAVDEAQGEWSYTVLAGDTDTVEEYIGELIELPLGVALRSETFDVEVSESSDL